MAAQSQEITLEGLTETLKNVRKLGVEVDDLKALNFEAGVIVAKKVRPPVDSGDLATTLRVAKAARAAKVTIGQRNKGWYSGFLEFGTKPSLKRKGSIKANPFLLEAKKASAPELYTHYDQGIAKLIQKNNLGD